MTDSVIQNAMSRRDAALAEARRWDDFIRMYGELRGKSPEMRGGDNPDKAKPHRVTTARRATGAMRGTEDAVIEILMESGRPMPTRALLDALIDRGVSIGGKEPISTLSARLSRAPRLINIRPDGWWVKEKAGDVSPEKEASPAFVLTPSTSVEPDEEVAHDNMTDANG